MHRPRTPPRCEACRYRPVQAGLADGLDQRSRLLVGQTAAGAPSMAEACWNELRKRMGAAGKVVAGEAELAHGPEDFTGFDLR